MKVGEIHAFFCILQSPNPFPFTTPSTFYTLTPPSTHFPDTNRSLHTPSTLTPPSTHPPHTNLITFWKFQHIFEKPLKWCEGGVILTCHTSFCIITHHSVFIATVSSKENLPTSLPQPANRSTIYRIVGTKCMFFQVF